MPAASNWCRLCPGLESSGTLSTPALELPRAVCVLTLHIVTEGNMNLACLDFKPKNKQPHFFLPWIVV
jgi:hypothetical protein